MHLYQITTPAYGEGDGRCIGPGPNASAEKFCMSDTEVAEKA